MTISGFIINNINQQSMRYQLRESAVLIANMVSDEIDFFSKTISSNLQQVAFSLKYFQTPEQQKKYLNSIAEKLADCEKLEVVNNEDGSLLTWASLSLIHWEIGRAHV